MCLFVGKCNNLHRALELANELPSRFGFSVDGYVFTALIAASISNGAAVLAGQLALQATASGIEIPHGVLCRLWNTLHLARNSQQQEGGGNVAELNAVYEGIWKLLGPQSKDPSKIGPEGIGVRKSRRRGGKQHHGGNSCSRQKQQSSSNTCSVHQGGPGASTATTPATQLSNDHRQQQVMPQGATCIFVSTAQSDWEGVPDSPTVESKGKQPHEPGMKNGAAAALWGETQNSFGGLLPW